MCAPWEPIVPGCKDAALVLKGWGSSPREEGLCNRINKGCQTLLLGQQPGLCGDSCGPRVPLTSRPGGGPGRMESLLEKQYHGDLANHASGMLPVASASVCSRLWRRPHPNLLLDSTPGDCIYVKQLSQSIGNTALVSRDVFPPVGQPRLDVEY